MEKSMDWILTVNGPGELSGQVKPVAREIRRQFPKARINLVIVPCQYASGYEKEMAKQISEIDRIYTPRDYRKLIFSKHKYEEFAPLLKGAIIYLGGDTFHAMLLHNKFKYPVFAYLEKEKKLSSKFKEVFTPKNAGNLMVDASEGLAEYSGRDIKDKELSIGLFPGSRKQFADYMIPVLNEIANKLKAKVKNLNFYWGIPFHLQRYAAEKFPEIINKYPDINSSKGVDLILTLLGTNTALYAVRGIPMLVLFPYNRPDLIPLMGLLGLLAKVPLLGWFIKWLALKIVSGKMGYVALPNVFSKEEITPEMKGYFKTDDVAKKAHELLKDLGLRNRISGQLRYSIGKPGAAKNIVEKIGEYLK